VPDVLPFFPLRALVLFIELSSTSDPSIEDPPPVLPLSMSAISKSPHRGSFECSERSSSVCPCIFVLLLLWCGSLISAIQSVDAGCVNTV
jgi:hypothetical protein